MGPLVERHLFKLIGFRNRLIVLINWAWDYLFYERAVRLILPLGEGPCTLWMWNRHRGGSHGGGGGGRECSGRD